MWQSVSVGNTVSEVQVWDGTGVTVSVGNTVSKVQV